MIITTYAKLNSYKATARELRVDVKQVKRWVERFQKEHTVQRRKGGGRKRILSEAASKRALQLLKSDKMEGAAHVAQELKRMRVINKLVDRQTVIRAARRVAASVGVPIRAVRGEPAKELSDATKTGRIIFSKRNADTSWKGVMFTDRKRFQFKFPGTKVKRVSWVDVGGKKPESKHHPHPPSVNVYAGLTFYGMTKPIIVAGTSKHKTKYTNKKGSTAKNITAAEYQDVLSKGLLPMGAAIFSKQNKADWVLQQDNDPTHRCAARVIKQWSLKHRSSPRLLPDWPGNSPDLNPIENAWAWVKRKVDREGHKTFSKYRKSVLYWVEHVPLEICRSLVSSMSRRLELVIARGGDKTGY